MEFFNRPSFNIALERLKLSNGEQISKINLLQSEDQALSLCKATMLHVQACEISRRLSEYHAWKTTSKESRNSIISKLANARGIKLATVKFHMKISGPMIDQILQWLGQELWGIVVVLLIYVEKWTSSNKTQSTNLQHSLQHLIPDPASYQGCEVFQTFEVMRVIEIVWSKSRKELRRKILTGRSMHELRLHKLLAIQKGHSILAENDSNERRVEEVE